MTGMTGLCARTLAAAVLLTGAAAGTAAAAGPSGGVGATVLPGATGAARGSVASGADGYSMRTAARFAPPTAFVPSAAVTYDNDLVPAGSGIEVRQEMRTGGARTTTVRLRVTGLRPGHAYGAHVHREPCGADPAAAGGHYQHRPSGDPAAVNPRNEVWLDFTADGRGGGTASARHDWGFRRGQASSVVLHGAPGGSGVRVACFTVPFGWAA
ncbi:superoxide dismutase family protein [Streptomyces sp. NPDC005925]|uniref:superoxide dismutase family protein n=1 Tax=Streptomyces sp. NPDC005925 TaxID=3157172 RepID=UPI0033E02A3B